MPTKNTDFQFCLFSWPCVASASVGKTHHCEKTEKTILIFEKQDEILMKHELGLSYCLMELSRQNVAIIFVAELPVKLWRIFSKLNIPVDFKFLK